MPRKKNRQKPLQRSKSRSFKLVEHLTDEFDQLEGSAFILKSEARRLLTEQRQLRDTLDRLKAELDHVDHVQKCVLFTSRLTVF